MQSGRVAEWPSGRLGDSIAEVPHAATMQQHDHKTTLQQNDTTHPSKQDIVHQAPRSTTQLPAVQPIIGLLARTRRRRVVQRVQISLQLGSLLFLPTHLYLCVQPADDSDSA